ncbi:MAG: hypothetical protein ACP5VR_06800 [Acidimicrobiales bacterium]
MNLLRRAPATRSAVDDGSDPEQTSAATPGKQLARQDAQANGRGNGATSAKQERAAARAARMQSVRQARKATSQMEPPEPRYGLYVAAFMVAVAVISLVSTDSEEVTKKVGKTTTTVWQVVPHYQVVPAAIAVLVLVSASAVTIYWRRRLVTMMAFMLTAALSISLPLPKSLADLRWGLYLVPLGYAMWVFWRQNKAQKTLLATANAGRQAPAQSATSSSGNSRRPQASRANAPTSRTKRKNEAQVFAPTGRPLPPSSGRYTRPQARPRTGQRKR